MSRAGWIGRSAVGTNARALWVGLIVALAGSPSNGQEFEAHDLNHNHNHVDPPGHAVVGEEPSQSFYQLPPDIQVVRFQGPEGVKLEILNPPPEPIPTADEDEGLATVGLRVGVGYRLRLSNLPNQPDAELFPVVEVVGHLHRPPDIDPSRFPIRVVFTQDDLDDVVDFGRLVTHVVYLEDPETAFPFALPKDQIPFVTLGPAEEPLKVASALGRVMAIVRLGGRTPSDSEMLLSSGIGPVNAPCPFLGSDGRPCQMRCGPLVSLPEVGSRLQMPKDEFLCDGGDFGNPMAFGPTGEVRGVDPRDAVIRFNDDRRPRLLPTNLVCVYAPRFAAVRSLIGPNQNLIVQTLAGNELVERPMIEELSQGPRPLTQNQAAELARHRARASALKGRVRAGEHFEVRVLAGVDVLASVDETERVQSPLEVQNRQALVIQQRDVPPLTIKTAEGAVVTGIIQSGSQTVMSWKPQELAAVEVPPNRPGLAVFKQVSASVAEPGDIVTYTIRFKNMGNVPVSNVSVIDNLLPRLEYVEGSARGPTGTIFTAAANEVGSTELRWDLPEPVLAGQEGAVSFQALIR